MVITLQGKVIGVALNVASGRIEVNFVRPIHRIVFLECSKYFKILVRLASSEYKFGFYAKMPEK